MRTRLPAAALAAAFACLLLAAPAQAQRDRTFVASYGTDTGNTICSFTQPCRTFQNAVNNTAINGEVTAIDSAGFQPVTISHGITITSPPGVEAGIVPPAGGDAVTISAPGSDVIILRGLKLNGSGVGYNGVVFNSGGGLTIDNCVMENFATNNVDATAGNGVFMRPTGGELDFVFTNSTFSHNPTGVLYLPTSGTANLNGAIDHVVMTGNFNGMEIAPHGGTNFVAVSNSTFNSNSTGIVAFSASPPFTVSIDSTNLIGNTTTGIEADGNVKVLLGHSVVTGNQTGVTNQTSNTFYTYGNNQINLNGTGGDVSGGLNVSITPR